ncbi:MAG TPA: hypothetical protein VKB14_06550 [Actinomycetales bacterium]|nr:hypothetical protein [Actinomycetales bacterium]
MTVTDDLAACSRDLAALRSSVLCLQTHLGETVDVQRLKDDVARVASDLGLLARQIGASEPTPTAEKVYIPDGDYDPSFWADAEDEGLGAPGRAH